MRFRGHDEQRELPEGRHRGRRFWPVRTGAIDLEALERDREQLWAEALQLYRRNRRWHLTDLKLVEMAKNEQAMRYETDVWEEAIVEHLVGKPEVTVKDIMQAALSMNTENMSRSAQNRVTSVLTKLGWKRGKRSSNGRHLWVSPKH